MALATYPGNTLSATLAKGKKKTILMADGMLTDGSGPNLVISRVYALGISVNGLAMQPFGPGGREAVEDCGAFRSDPNGECEVTGQWWLDMDDPANSALLNVPITVTLAGETPAADLRSAYRSICRCECGWRRSRGGPALGLTVGLRMGELRCPSFMTCVRAKRRENERS